MPFQRLGALLLALCFTISWSLNSLHDLLWHHEHPVCEAAYDGKGTHIHDERYEAHGCSLCALLMSAPVLTGGFALETPASRLPESGSPNFYHAPVESRTTHDGTFRRGPPVG